MVAHFPSPLRLTSTITMACFPVTFPFVSTGLAAFLDTVRSIRAFWTLCDILNEVDCFWKSSINLIKSEKLRICYLNLFENV